MKNNETFNEVALYVAESFSKKNSQAAYLDRQNGLWADDLQAELNKLADSSSNEKEYLDAIMEHMLTPYYQQLEQAEKKIRDRVEKKISEDIVAKESFDERRVEQEATQLFWNDAQVEEKTKKIERIPDDKKREEAHKKLQVKIATEINSIRKVKSRFAWRVVTKAEAAIRIKTTEALTKCEEEIKLAVKTERARINHNLRQTKISINRGLQAYNDNHPEKEWFLSRVVALQHAVSSFVPPTIENPDGFKRALNKAQEISRTIKRDELKPLLKKYMPLHYEFYIQTKTVPIELVVQHARNNAVNYVGEKVQAFIEDRVRSAPGNEKEYRDYFSKLTEQWQQDLLESEWDRVTRNRISFRERLKEAQRNETGKSKHQLMLDILAGMCTDKGSDYCNKSYVSVEYNAKVLKKAKNNIKRRNKIAHALVTVGTIVVAGSEGAAVGVATNSLEIGLAGFLSNAPTMYADSQGPIKDLMNGRMLGEKGQALDKSKRIQAGIFSASAFGFSAGLALIAIGSISAICPLVGIAVAISSLSLFLVYAMFQKQASDGAMEGEGAVKSLFLDLYNFKKIWATLKENVSEKKRLVIFVFRDILGKAMMTVFKLIAVAAAIISFLVCSKNFVGSKLINGSKLMGVLLGVCGSIIAAPTNILFVQMKVRGLKHIFVKWIKSLVGNSNGVHVFRKMARLIAHFLKGSLKLIISVGVFAAAILVGIFSFAFWLGKKLGLAIRHARDMRRHKRNVMSEKIKNHKIHANFRKNMSEALGDVSNTTLGVCALANGAGQGVLYAQPMLSLFRNNMALNWIGAVITFLMQGICSFVLNADGANSATKEILGDGMREKEVEKPSVAVTECSHQWKEFASTVLKQFFSLWVLLAQHFFGAKDKAKVSARYDGFTSVLTNSRRVTAAPVATVV